MYDYTGLRSPQAPIALVCFERQQEQRNCDLTRTRPAEYPHVDYVGSFGVVSVSRTKLDFY